MDQLPPEDFEKVELEFLFCLFCQKLVSCGEKAWLWEKGKEWSIYAKFESKQFWVLICIDVALPLVAF
jgi:hypothetical protein